MILDGLSYPFQWAIGVHPSSELPFRDVRFAAAAVLVPLAGFAALIRARRLVAPIATTLNVVTAFFLIGFVLWLFLFGVSRYIVLLELLSGIVVVGALLSSVAAHRAPIVAVVLAVALVATTSISNWGRVRPGQTWFEVAVPAERLVPDQLFVMTSQQPIGYVIPYLPGDARFVRIESNMSSFLVAGSAYLNLVHETIAGHAGPIYSLGPSVPNASAAAVFSGYGLTLSAGSCVEICSRLDVLYSCPLGPAD